MTTTHGKKGKVKVGSTPSVVGQTTKWSLTQTVGVADATAQGDDWQSHLTSIPGWNGSIDANFDPGDTNGQVALAIGASVDLELYHNGDTSGETYFSGTASVTQIQVNSSKDGINTVSFTFQGNGALTTATVA